MLILECSQGCYGRTNDSVTISLRNFVGEGKISKSFSSLLIGCVRRPTPSTDKGSSNINDDIITFNGIYVLNFKF